MSHARESEGQKAGVAERVVVIVLCVIFLPIIVINIILVAKTYLQPEHIPGVFGIKPVIVVESVMQPLFDDDALIFLKSAQPDTLAVGDVICYMEDGTAYNSRIHDIVTDESGATLLVTQGDMSLEPDDLQIYPEQVEGIYIGQIAGLGGFALFMQSTTGMILFIACPVALYLVVDLLLHRQDKRREKARSDELERELRTLREEKESGETVAP